MRFSIIRCLPLSVAVSVGLSIGTPAVALKINLIDIGGVTGSQAQRGFALAARYWESVLTNPVTMNIQVGYATLDPDILGGTRTSLFTDVPVALSD